MGNIMATELLKLAQQSLEFESLFQNTVQAELTNGFEPKQTITAKNALSIQFRHAVTNSMILEVKNANAKHNIFRVKIAVGLRYLKTEKKQNNQEVAAKIEATYSIDYLVQNEELLSNQEALDEFALKNASYHLWPFWREFAMAQAQRMNLPPVPLPMRLPV